MVRKGVYIKEMIFEVVIKFFKKEGLDVIIVKNIVKEFNCLVVFIYFVYLSLDDLKKDLVFEIEKNIFEEKNIYFLFLKMFVKLEVNDIDE